MNSLLFKNLVETNSFTSGNEKVTQDSAKKSVWGNILRPAIGEQYVMRLLWFDRPEGFPEIRQYPMVLKETHKFYDETTKTFHNIICPKTEYIHSNSIGKDYKCPICEKFFEVYKSPEFQAGDPAAVELKSRLKQTLVGYIPVYIVSYKPANSAEQDTKTGKVFLLEFNIQLKKFFMSKVFSGDEDAIGLDAFMYFDGTNDKLVTEGYNFLLKVGSKTIPNFRNQVRDPSYDFARQKTSITSYCGQPLTKNLFKTMADDCKIFDMEFYETSTLAEAEQYVALATGQAVDTFEDEYSLADPEESKSFVTKPAEPAEPAPAVNTKEFDSLQDSIDDLFK